MGNRTRTKITKMRTRRPAARRSPIDRSCMALRELYTLKLSHRLRSVDQGRLSPPPVLRGGDHRDKGRRITQSATEGAAVTEGPLDDTMCPGIRSGSSPLGRFQGIDLAVYQPP